MTIKRVILAAVMGALCVLGWFHLISGSAERQERFDEYYESGKAYLEKQLYQKAAADLEDALSLKEDEAVRDLLVESYWLAYQEGSIARNVYKNALTAATDKYPTLEKYWAKLIRFYVDLNSFTEANKALDRAARAGAKGDDLKELRLKVTYAVRSSGKMYTECHQADNGYITATNNVRWIVIQSNGEEVDYSGEDRTYVSPMNDEQTAVYRTGSRTVVCDAKMVVQSILNADFAAAKAIGSGILPVQAESGSWRFLRYEEGTFLPGEYEDVSAFQDGRAYVLQNGVWRSVDTSGNLTGGPSFSGLRLHGNGAYILDGVMVAAEGGVWAMYGPEGEKLSEFTASDMDAYYGDLIAFRDGNGKWGFMNKKGEIDIEPAYAEARSFSNGLGAIRTSSGWGFVNKDAVLAIGGEYLDVGYFTSGGVCPVSTVEGYYNLIMRRFP